MSKPFGIYRLNEVLTAIARSIVDLEPVERMDAAFWSALYNTLVVEVSSEPANTFEKHTSVLYAVKDSIEYSNLGLGGKRVAHNTVDSMHEYGIHVVCSKNNCCILI